MTTQRRFDIEPLNTVNLAVLVERDLGPARLKRGKHLLWVCPFHDDHDPSFDVNTARNCAYCNPCGKSFTPLKWLMDYRRLDFKSACRDLEGMLGLSAPAVSVQPKAEPYEPPSPDWQRAANEIVYAAQKDLWSDTPGAARVRSWLNRRGLADDTLREWCVGYAPEGAKHSGLWCWPGVILPARMDGYLWGIKIRLLPDHPFRCQGCARWLKAPGACPRCGKKNKYRGVPGSRPALFGAATCAGRRVCFGCEGEFDALVAWQEACNLGGVFTSTNGAGKDWRPEWFTYVMDAERIVLLYDNDEAGEKGKSKMEQLGRRVRSVRVPGECKDVTDFHLTGEERKLQAWLAMVRRCALESGYAPGGEWLPYMQVRHVAPGHDQYQAELDSLRTRLTSSIPATLRADYEHDIRVLEQIIGNRK